MHVAHIGNPAGVADELVAAQQAMGIDADLWPQERFKLPRGLRRLELRGYDVIHLHSFRLLPHAMETLLPGAKVILHHHGSDVRGKGEPAFARFAHHRFATVDSVMWAPGAEWLPNPATANWPSSFWHRDYGHVLHGEGEPHKAGTRFVEESCRQLGVELLGRSDTRAGFHLQMCSARVVIGKVTRWCGGPGRTNLEAMAMGKPTMCYMSPQVAAMMPGKCPVVPVTPETLETVLRAVLSSADYRAELGSRGREYVAMYHDPKVISARCLEVYR